MSRTSHQRLCGQSCVVLVVVMRNGNLRYRRQNSRQKEGSRKDAATAMVENSSYASNTRRVVALVKPIFNYTRGSRSYRLDDSFYDYRVLQGMSHLIELTREVEVECGERALRT
jgi:hypothetical protein